MDLLCEWRLDSFSARLLQPGTSKTLSFHIVLANLRGPDSPKPFCRKFVALDPFFLLCSPTTTSNEVTLTFNRAIERNDRYEQSNTQRRVVVFVDEGKDECIADNYLSIHEFCISHSHGPASTALRLCSWLGRPSP